MRAKGLADELSIENAFGDCCSILRA
jgi:hypothetical protein